MTESNNTPRRVVASYRDYGQAERAVDYLSDHGFPVEKAAIVGRDLELVEQITGRLTYWGATGRGAASGAVVGALIGWLFGLFDWIAPLVAALLLAFYGAIFGAVIGALIGLIGHALTGGRRDFRSVPGFRASSYDVLVDDEVTDRATDMLAQIDSPPGSHGATEPRGHGPDRRPVRPGPHHRRVHQPEPARPGGHPARCPQHQRPDELRPDPTAHQRPDHPTAALQHLRAEPRRATNRRLLHQDLSPPAATTHGRQ